MADIVQLPRIRGQVARHKTLKVTAGELGELQSCARNAEHLSSIGFQMSRFGPISINTGRS